MMTDKETTEWTPEPEGLCEAMDRLEVQVPALQEAARLIDEAARADPYYSELLTLARVAAEVQMHATIHEATAAWVSQKLTDHCERRVQ